MKNDAAQLLSRLKPGFMYQDYRLLEQGAYRELAQKFRKNARFLTVVFGLFSAYIVAECVFMLLDSSPGGSSTIDAISIVSGWVGIVFGLALLGFSTWNQAQNAALCDRVLEITGEAPQTRAREAAAVALRDAFDRVPEQWSPRVVAALNDYRLKIARIEGEFVWHSHEDTDEAFLVMDGHMRLEFRDGQVDMGPGDLYVVPAGVEHRPVAEKECRILLIEPAGVTNTGRSGGPQTAENDVWL